MQIYLQKSTRSKGGNVISDGYTLEDSLKWFASVKPVFRGEGTSEQVAELRKRIATFEVDG